MTEIVKKNLKTLSGTVVSTRMADTVVVKVDRKVPHPKYKKLMTVSGRYKASLSGHKVSLGDVVSIKSTRPKSKSVSFAVVDVAANVNK